MIIYINQSVRINFEIGVDTTLTTQIVLNYRKPSGTEGTFTPIQVEDAPLGKVFYEAQVGEIDESGIWVFWSDVTTASGQFPGHPFTIEVKEEGVSITNKDFVKSYLGITDDTQAAVIESLIILAEEDYLNIRNKPWDTDAEGNTIYPPGSDVVVAQMIGYKLNNKDGDGRLVSSESIGSYSVSYGDATGQGNTFGYPKGVVGSIKRYIKGA
jgi:hypothetical protein